MDFAERLLLLEEFDIVATRSYEYRGEGADRQQVALDLIEGVVLPLTLEDWSELCQRDGDAYVGGCCSALSVIQDAMQGVFRDSGYIPCQDLDRIIEALRLHGQGDDDSDVAFDPSTPLQKILTDARAAWGEYTPWGKIAVTWHIIKDCFTAKQPDGFAPHLAPLDQALNVLAGSICYLNLSRLFHDKGQDSTAETQGQVSRMLAVARLLPALKTLNDHVHELALPPIEGFVIVGLGDHEQVLHNGFGHCFYLDEADVHRMAETWRKSEEYQDPVRKPNLRPLGVRRARVSVEKGVEFLDDGPVPLPV